MNKKEDGFELFYNEFKNWTKKQLLHRTYDIILKDTEEIGEKDKEIERLNTEIDYLNKLRDENVEELKKKDNIINNLSKNIDMWNRKYNEQFNIIDKLEKYAIIMRKHNTFETGTQAYHNIIIKIEKLKEGDDNE